jgi:hypothetical protein
MSLELLKILDGEDEEDSLGDEGMIDFSVDDEEPDYIWLGNHSFSCVTLEELVQYDLDQPVTLRGMVSTEAARRWRENKEPPNAVAAYSAKPDFVYLEWQRPLRESAPLIVDLIDVLSPLGEPRDVRIIFGFDT